MSGSSYEESVKALAAARKALDEQEGFRFGNTKLENEFCELDLYTASERLIALDIALSAIRPEDRCGPNPPGHISTRPYQGRPLYAFTWKSQEFGMEMYLKFCLTGTTGTEHLVLYSFHKNHKDRS